MELAVCLPLLMIVAVGSIEATNAIFLKEHLTSAAYEAARRATATVPWTSNDNPTKAAQYVLGQFGILGGIVQIVPTTVTSSTPAGTQVTVTVSAPLGSNSCMQPFIIGKAITNVGARVVMDHQ